MPAPHDLTRRRALTAALATGASLTAAACSSGSTDSAKGSSAAPGSSSAAASATTSSGPAGAADVPSKQEILAKFGHRTPKAWGLNLTGQTLHVPVDGHAVALTFDACGGPGGSGYDEKLIALLRKHQVKATLFLNQRWITKNESLAKELAADPLFQLGNHGLTHRPLSTTGRSAYGIAGTESLSALYDEVRGARDWIAAHQSGHTIFFRSGTAYSDDIGVDVCTAMKSPFLGFSLNGDAGATFTKEQIKATLLTVKAGDVVISHMNQPTHATAAGYASVLPQLIDSGVTFRHVPA